MNTLRKIHAVLGVAFMSAFGFLVSAASASDAPRSAASATYWAGCHGHCTNGDQTRDGAVGDDCNLACQFCYARMEGTCEASDPPASLKRSFSSCDYCDVNPPSALR